MVTGVDQTDVAAQAVAQEVHAVQLKFIQETGDVLGKVLRIGLEHGQLVDRQHGRDDAEALAEMRSHLLEIAQGTKQTVQQHHCLYLVKLVPLSNLSPP